MVTFVTKNSVYKFDEDRKMYLRFPRKEMREGWENKDGPFTDGQWLEYDRYEIKMNATLVIYTPLGDLRTSMLEREEVSGASNS